MFLNNALSYLRSTQNELSTRQHKNAMFKVKLGKKITREIYTEFIYNRLSDFMLDYDRIFSVTSTASQLSIIDASLAQFGNDATEMMLSNAFYIVIADSDQHIREVIVTDIIILFISLIVDSNSVQEIV